MPCAGGLPSRSQSSTRARSAFAAERHGSAAVGTADVATRHCSSRPSRQNRPERAPPRCRPPSPAGSRDDHPHAGQPSGSNGLQGIGVNDENLILTLDDVTSHLFGQLPGCGWSTPATRTTRRVVNSGSPGRMARTRLVTRRGRLSLLDSSVGTTAQQGLHHLNQASGGHSPASPRSHLLAQYPSRRKRRPRVVQH